jgi:hypothetical protein
MSAQVRMNILKIETPHHLNKNTLKLKLLNNKIFSEYKNQVQLCLWYLIIPENASTWSNTSKPMPGSKNI